MQDEERVMTSAICDMSVAEVRKALAFMRKEWSQHSSIHPFFPSRILPDYDMNISDFSFKFVMGHHAKRHHRNPANTKEKKKINV